MNIFWRIGFLVGCMFFLNSVFAQVITSSAEGMTPHAFLQEVMDGNGIIIKNVRFNWSNHEIQTPQIGTFRKMTPETDFPFNSGIVLTTGDIAVVKGPNTSTDRTRPVPPEKMAIPDDDLLSFMPDATLSSTTVLEFDFVTPASSFDFNYLFASEEYPEAVCTKWNDVFAFFLTGKDPVTQQVTTKNIAIVPNSVSLSNPQGLPVSVNTINGGEQGEWGSAEYCVSLDNSDFYVDNTYGSAVEYDGYTVPLKASADVLPCETYHIKMTLANVNQNAYDSGVFLDGESFSGVSFKYETLYEKPVDSLVEGCNNMRLKIALDRPLDFEIPISITTSGNATSGVDYESLPSMVTFLPGDTVKYIDVIVLSDDLVEGTESIIIGFDMEFCQEKLHHELTVPILDYYATYINDTFCENDSYEYNGETYTSPGVYTHHFNSSWGCDSVVILTLQMSSLPIINLQPDIYQFCRNEFHPFTIDAGSGYEHYRWSDGSTGHQCLVADAGVYTVTVSNHEGCVASDTITVVITDNPEVTIVCSPENFCEVGVATLFALTQGEDFQWSTGENTQQIEVSASGYYSVTVSREGCSSSASTTLPVCPCKIFIPNSFTPDGDGINDFFAPVFLADVENYSMAIYDRVGEMIYYTNNILQPWDGTYHGQEVNTGTFVYYVTYSCSEDAHRINKVKGVVNLLR